MGLFRFGDLFSFFFHSPHQNTSSLELSDERQKNPQCCCEVFGQVALCLVPLAKLQGEGKHTGDMENNKVNKDFFFFFWHEIRVMESPLLLPHLFLIHTWQQWCARGCWDGSPLSSLRVLFWRMGDGGGLAYFTSLFSNGILLCLPFFFLTSSWVCQ